MKLDARDYQRGEDATCGLLDAFIQDRMDGFEGAFQAWLEHRDGES